MNKIKKNKRTKKVLFIRSKKGHTRYELLLLRTNCNIYAYIIDMEVKKVLFSVSTLSSVVKEKISSTKSKASNKSGAEIVGQTLAERYIKEGLENLPYINIASYKYHGRVKALVEMFVSVMNKKI